MLWSKCFLNSVRIWVKGIGKKKKTLTLLRLLFIFTYIQSSSYVDLKSSRSSIAQLLLLTLYKKINCEEII